MKEVYDAELFGYGKFGETETDWGYGVRTKEGNFSIVNNIRYFDEYFILEEIEKNSSLGFPKMWGIDKLPVFARARAYKRTVEETINEFKILALQKGIIIGKIEKKITL